MKDKVALFNVSDFVRRSRFSSLGLAYIASYLRKFSTHNDISIVEGDGMRKLEFLKPDIVGLFSVSQSFNEACAVAGAIKRRYGIPVIVGGYHISALPQTLPDAFDIGVIGEGEETMKELVDVLAASGLDRERLRSVRGIAFRDTDGRVRVTPERGYIRDLDSIPLPARDLQEPSAFPSIITSRGCPYRCIFCSSVKYWGAPRFHSPGYVVNEIKDIIARYYPVHISIWDDLFIANRARLEAICGLLKKDRINKKVSFGCAVRSNLVTPELCRLLRDMNIRRVSIGFESGSARILSMLKCNSVTVEQHVRAVELLKKAGIFTTGTFMIGSPTETEQDLRDTLNLITRLKLRGGGSISLAAPLPGTELWAYAKQKGLLDERTNPSMLGLMSTDFAAPEQFKGILLTDQVPRNVFFKLAQEMQRQSNKYYIRGLFHYSNLSWTNIRFVFARPAEVLAMVRYLVKSLFKKASLMERYVFYYKKMAD